MPFKNITSMPALKGLDGNSSDSDSSADQTAPTIARTVSSIELNESGEFLLEHKPTVDAHVGYKKVLVTGGAGFIGSNVAEYLLNRGDDVVIVDEMNDYYDVSIKEMNLEVLRTLVKDMLNAESRLKIYKGDICDEEFMMNLFETECPSHGSKSRCLTIHPRPICIPPLEHPWNDKLDGIITQIQCQELRLRLFLKCIWWIDIYLLLRRRKCG